MWEIHPDLPHVEVGQQAILSIIFAHRLLEFGGKGKRRWVEMWEIMNHLAHLNVPVGGQGLFLEGDLWKRRESPTRRLSSWCGLS
jgi:hypothetical protein